jgi:plasmid stabilization system protein ParE
MADPSSLRILSAAEREVAEAFAWYEARQPGLGFEFMRAVDARVYSIRRSPEMCGFIQRPYRCAIVRRFPYMIVYRYSNDDDTVIVYAVFHTAQDPDKWRLRLP